MKIKTQEIITGLFSLVVIICILGFFGYLVWFHVWLNTTQDGMEVRSELSPHWKAADALEKMSDP